LGGGIEKEDERDDDGCVKIVSRREKDEYI